MSRNLPAQPKGAVGDLFDQGIQVSEGSFPVLAPAQVGQWALPWSDAEVAEIESRLLRGQPMKADLDVPHSPRPVRPGREDPFVRVCKAALTIILGLIAAVGAVGTRDRLRWYEDTTYFDGSPAGSLADLFAMASVGAIGMIAAGALVFTLVMLLSTLGVRIPRRQRPLPSNSLLTVAYIPDTSEGQQLKQARSSIA